MSGAADSFNMIDNTISTTSVGSPAIPISPDELQDRLDGLWMEHLACLDIYVKARDRLARELSSGFISLSQANFKSSRYRNYGPDDYDTRMKAGLRVRCDVDDASTGNFKLVRCDQLRGDRIVDESRSKSMPDADVLESTSDNPAHSKHGESHNADDDQNETEPEEADKSDENYAVDPIKWFGILIPSDLRTAQASFVRALDTSTVDAINAAQRLRVLDAEIRRTRRQITKETKRNVVKARNT